MSRGTIHELERRLVAAQNEHAHILGQRYRSTSDEQKLEALREVILALNDRINFEMAQQPLFEEES